MKIKLDGKTCIVDKVGFLGKIFGLMFSRKRNLLFDLDFRKEIVHSLFVFYSIKLFFLDKDFKIIEKRVLRPFWFYIPKIKAKYLVEIPAKSSPQD